MFFIESLILLNLPSGSVSHSFPCHLCFLTSSFSFHLPPSLPALPPPGVCSDKDSCSNASATPLECKLNSCILWEHCGKFLQFELFPIEEAPDRDRRLSYELGTNKLVAQSSTSLLDNWEANMQPWPSMPHDEELYLLLLYLLWRRVVFPIRPQWSSQDSTGGRSNQYHSSSQCFHHPWRV